MKATATFYHAGCPVCISAEETVARALDPSKYNVQIVHLGESPDQIGNAEQAGVKSVPALVMNGEPFHINFGAALADLKS